MATKKRKSPGRTASEPLHIMLTPAQKARYERLALEIGVPMRELVVMALDRLDSESAQPVEPTPRNGLADPHGVYELLRDIHQPHAGDDGKPRPPSVDLAALVTRVVGLLRRVDSLERKVSKFV
ncbi:MAG: hypothetical protein M3680_14605 [Myxococcota bacterium]|nr:hypothetical protein [Myxococcota bacterium]